MNDPRLDTTVKNRWIADARRSYPRADAVVKRSSRWERWRTVVWLLVASLFFEIGYLAGRWHAVEPPTIRPIPSVTCPDGTVMEAE